MTTSGIAAQRYNRLIESARLRSASVGYMERHHVLPRSEGGTDAPENLVYLTAREHFLAHWLLYRMYRTPASARAFKLMVNDQQKRRGRDYASARELMASAMRGQKNVAKRPEVREKLRANAHAPFAGKKRPQHSELMRLSGVWKHENNPWYGQGDRQRGADNHMARKVVGLHVFHGVACWDTLRQAAEALGVTIQAVSQAIRRGSKSKGWRLEHAS